MAFATLSPLLQNLLALLRGSCPQYLCGADTGLLRGGAGHRICSQTTSNVDQMRGDPHGAHPGYLRLCGSGYPLFGPARMEEQRLESRVRAVNSNRTLPLQRLARSAA